MIYVPTAQDAIKAYFSAVADYHNVSPDIVDWPILHNVKESAPSTFTIQMGTDIIIVMYNQLDDLWRVRLEDGKHLKVRNTADNFVVVKE